MSTSTIFSGKTLLLVNTGSNKKRYVLQKLAKLGLRLIVLNKEKNWAQPYVDDWILANTNDHQESLSAVANFFREHPAIKIDGALTFWEDDVILTSKITSKFNWIGNTYETVKKVRNKFEFRKFCQLNGIRSPKHALIRTKKDLQRIKEEFSFPLVMKPVYGASSAYVIKVEEEEDLERVYNYIKENLSLQTESSLHDGFDIFVEEYIDGDEVDVDILMQNGKVKFYSITDNFQTEEPFFVETGDAIPSSLPDNRQEALFELAEETLEKLKIQNGCIHFEAKSTKSGPVPIEVNLRMGGDYIYSIIKAAWGVDMIENAVKIALGVYLPKIKKPEVPKKYIVGQYFLPSHSGILSKLTVDEKLKKARYKELIEELYIEKEIGDAVLVPPEGFENLGWVTVSGETQADARNNMEDILRYTNYEISRFHPASSIGKIARKNQFSVASTNKNALLNKARIEKFKKISYKNQRSLHVGIACDRTLDFADSSDLSSLIQKRLEKQGYKVSRFDLNNIQKTLYSLGKSDIDFIFNICEKIHETSLLEPHATALFDILQIPYSGSNLFTLSLCIDKIQVKKLLQYHGIPTPKWDYAYAMDDKLITELKYPLIVKPSNSDNSFGITNDSVVTNPKELQRQLKQVIEIYKRPALIEEYIEGDEYDVCLLGNDEGVQVLPLIRSIFDHMPAGYWHIYSSNLKSGKDKKAAEAIRVEKPAKIPKKLDNLLSEIALDVYNIFGCFDYGKVEIRVDKNGNPYVLELNPNPPLQAYDFLPSAAKLAGYSYDALIEEIILLGINRYKDRPPFYHLQY